MRRCLIVANQTLSTDTLRRAVQERIDAEDVAALIDLAS